MTSFTLKCDIIHRLAGLCDYFEPSTPPEIKDKINTIRLENKSGRSFAVATNRVVAAVEFIGVTDQPDGTTHLKLTEAMLKAAYQGSLLGETITIMTIPEIAMSSLQTQSGFTMNDCCYWFDDTPLDEWRDWARPTPKQSQGAMYWNLYHIESLLKSSPSGKVVFPEFINSCKAVTIRDVENENWAGLFIPEPPVTQGYRKPAEQPDWWGE